MLTEEEAIELLRQRITESGLSTTRFANLVMVRERRTVGRWLSGHSAIPLLVREWLQQPERSPWP